jgi:multiple sugar transport system permease protein
MQKGSIPGRIIKAIILLITCLMVIFPFWMFFITSLREKSVLFETPPKFWVENPTLENYKSLLTDPYVAFPNWFLNSLIVGVVTTAITLVITSLAAYAFAKKQFPGRTFLFMVCMATMMVPRTVTLLPTFTICRYFFMIDNLWGMIIPCVTNVFGIFLLKQFMATIPSSLIESARIDGASELRVFTHIIIPVSRSALGVLAINTFMNQWNNLLWPLIIAQTEQTKTLPVGIASLKSLATVPWNLIMAATMLSFIPVLIVFICARKSFIEGMTAGAIKG